MESIELLNIIKNNKTVEYKYKFTPGLSKFLTGQRFIIHYPKDISNVPDSVLAIPFVSNLVQLTWVTDSKLILPSLDKDFYDCLPNLRNAFEKMFPETVFRGELICKSVVDNKPNSQNRVAMFYSGGVDSMQTFISHFKEDIDLLSIWGSDIDYDNEEGWNILQQSIEDSVEPFKLKPQVIHSSFRKIEDENSLYKTFSKQLKDTWWHGIQHGAALLGHAAPLAYLNGYKNVYIASSHSTHDKNTRCASHPTTDNCLRFCGCRVIHDGFKYRRQEKIKNITNFEKDNPQLPIRLHVCRKTQSGNNCCLCEKCARTIYAFLIEGADPSKFGFEDFEKTLTIFNEKNTLAYLTKHIHTYHAWFDIAERVVEQKEVLKGTKYWNKLKWLAKVDRNKPNSYKVRYNPIKRFAIRLLNKIHNAKANFAYSKSIRKNKSNKTVYLFGTPTHCNIGDAAIAQAEIDFIKDCGFDVFEITVNDWKRYKNVIKRRIKPRLILLHGGGNFGNLWPYEERMREDIISNLKASRYLLFPQTFFLKDSVSRDDIDSMKMKYNNESFFLFAREKFSYEKMMQIFPKAKSFIVPDIVLFEKENNFFKNDTNDPKTDVLLVLRGDREGVLGYDGKKQLEVILNKKQLSFKKSDMLYKDAAISKDDRKRIIIEKLNEFVNSKLIITDRLHGMIFAYLAGVPCVVLHNNNYKIDGVYEWIKDKASVILTKDLSEISKAIDETINKNTFKPFEKKYFDDLKHQLCLEVENAIR